MFFYKVVNTLPLNLALTVRFWLCWIATLTQVKFVFIVLCTIGNPQTSLEIKSYSFTNSLSYLIIYTVLFVTLLMLVFQLPSFDQKYVSSENSLGAR